MTQPAGGRPSRWSPRGLAGLSAAAIAVGLLAGCGGGSGPASTAAAPVPVAPGQTTARPNLAGVQLPDFQMPLIKGGVSRPKARLTPGVVTTTDTNAVCELPTHGGGNAMSFSTQAAIFAEYGYTAPAQQHKYLLDYLVPVDLGGAAVNANIWPASVRGVGFYQKVQTDHILRDLVCRRTLSLTLAQHDLKTDWYAAWLRYVVASGHA